MRILFVNEKCGYFGGVEQNVSATVRGLNDLGHDCYLAYGETARDHEAYRSLFKQAYQCADVCVPGTFSSAVPFNKIVETISPDVLYVHKTSDTGFLKEFVDKIRIVRMVHDHDLCCPRKHKYFFHNTRVCHYKAGWRCYLDLAFVERGRNILNRFNYVNIQTKLVEMRRNYEWDSLLVGSHFMKDELIMNGFPSDRVQIVPPSVPMKPTRITEPAREPSILCVAQLIRGKGLDLLLHSFNKLKCHFSATIIGTGNAEAELKELCHKLGLDDRVNFTGWVNNDSIGSYYANSRVVAVPSRWPEPFGMIGLEAMRYARPVVAFDVGGIPDWLENEITGLLVAEQDTGSFAQALERMLLDHNLAVGLGEAGLKRAQENFSFEKFLYKIEKCLKHD